jgi:GH15 family glucan-1,4-alpha-glucosidase
MATRSDPADSYVPIKEYAIIGNCRSAALISRAGSIDWFCPERFDAPAVLSRILDARRGGFLSVAPDGAFESARRYLPGTNVLETVHRHNGAAVKVTDFMSVSQSNRGTKAEAPDEPRIVRRIEGLQGAASISVRFRPVANYGLEPAECETIPDAGVLARCGEVYVGLGGVSELRCTDGATWEAAVHVAEGQVRVVHLVHSRQRQAAIRAMSAAVDDDELKRTTDFWEQWSARCTYRGPYREEIVRSALTLKLLTFDPTGAVVAAPTTSLPEEIGGVRNWDYRFTWLRDSALILYALLTVGYHDEAGHFLSWLRGVVGRHLHRFPQIMYTIEGHRDLPERTLDELEGYRQSRPVRIGNAASKQKQLDIYGEVLIAAYIHYHRPDPAEGTPANETLGSRTPDEPTWEVIRALVDDATRVWKEKDSGIWEVRGGPQHFVYSKLMCWAAVDRGIKIAEEHDLDAEIDRWKRTRDEIRQAIEEHGYNERIGAFVQTFGSDTLDAALLAIPRVGFLPATDPRVLSTINQIQQHLLQDGQVYRYRSADGLPGGEGAFLLCTFWLVDALALAGRMDEAQQLFDRARGLANDVGLFSEEIDPKTGEFLGNFPQGFTHLALMRAAADLAKGKKHGAEEHAQTEAERVHHAHRAVKEGHG